MAESEKVSEDTPADRELSGSQLGDYRILRRLGRGGMADVYLADQQSLRRQVALKVLRPALAADENYVRRFHNEAQAAAALVHANIVQIYEVGCIDDVHFIAQEYVDGANLKQLVSRHGALEAATANLIMRQVASALHKAGTQGIIHRDIKPENILLSSGGQAKVADFGLARITSDPTKMGLTQVGVAMGTPLYMSPEQVQGQEIDSRSDIYSLGVTCYQMLAGRPPFEGETALNVAVQHLNSEAERLENVRSDLPSDLCRLVHKMLAKDPNDRYANAAELLRDLRELRVDGQQVEWPDDLHDLETSEQLALSTARTAATQQLQVVMSESTGLARTKISRRWLWPAAACLAFVVGGILAASNQFHDVLAIGSNEVLPAVDKLDSVEEQYFYAQFRNTEEAWESVWRHYPIDTEDSAENAKNRPHVYRAKHQLARLYLEHDEDERALQIFQWLAEVDSTEVQFVASGLVGEAIVLARRNDFDGAANKCASAQQLLAKSKISVGGMLQQDLQHAQKLIANGTLRQSDQRG